MQEFEIPEAVRDALHQLARRRRVARSYAEPRTPVLFEPDARAAAVPLEATDVECAATLITFGWQLAHELPPAIPTLSLWSWDRTSVSLTRDGVLRRHDPGFAAAMRGPLAVPTPRLLATALPAAQLHAWHDAVQTGTIWPTVQEQLAARLPAGRRARSNRD